MRCCCLPFVGELYRVSDSISLHGLKREFLGTEGFLVQFGFTSRFHPEPSFFVMDVYRVLHQQSHDCVAHCFLRKIFHAGQPAVDLDRPTVDILQKRDQALFFPYKAIQRIFTPRDDTNPVKSMLACGCQSCKQGRKGSNLTERGPLADRIMERPMTVLLAILIFIGHAYLIRHFASHDRIGDNSLDSVTEYVKSKENHEKWQKLLLRHGIDGFCNFYNSARNLFEPPTFTMGEPTAEYLNVQRMPFLDEKLHTRGSSGKVFKFNIHPDYLDEAIKVESWYTSANHVRAGLHSFQRLTSALNPLIEISAVQIRTQSATERYYGRIGMEK